MIKIDFSFDTEFGKFIDNLHLPDIEVTTQT